MLGLRAERRERTKLRSTTPETRSFRKRTSSDLTRDQARMERKFSAPTPDSENRTSAALSTPTWFHLFTLPAL